MENLPGRVQHPIKFVKGKENMLPDMLSREGYLQLENKDVSYCFPPSKDKIKELQTKANNILENDKIIKDKSGIYKLKKTQQIIIAESYVHDLLTSFHFKLGHPGMIKTVNTLNEIYFIHNLQKKVRENIQKCKFCCENKVQNITSGTLEGDLRENIPWKKIFIALYGPILKEETGFIAEKERFYLLVIIDGCTRWIEVAVVDNCSTDEISSKL